MSTSAPYRAYRVSTRRRPLLDFMLDALRGSGCIILACSPDDVAPFKVSFVTPWGERMGIIAYAFTANSRPTLNRPDDEHRFQVKYGSKDGQRHELWQDPFGLYTTLFLGINAEPSEEERARGLQPFFVGADPVINSPTKFFISKEFKEHQAQAVAATGWHTWERDHRGESEEPVEVFVGGTAEHFLRYVLLEREAKGEDQGHRQLLAEQFAQAALPSAQNVLAALTDKRMARDGMEPLAFTMSAGRLHALEQEFGLDADAVLDLIARAPRLKMAVRGWVAERHLGDQLAALPSVAAVAPIEKDGQPDFRVEVRGGTHPVLVECKNVLRVKDKAGHARLDFMKTRVSQDDRCSRYYSAADFHVIAACLHATTERWEFAMRQTATIPSHKACLGKLQHRLTVDTSWSRDMEVVLREAAAG